MTLKTRINTGLDAVGQREGAGSVGQRRVGNTRKRVYGQDKYESGEIQIA